jgi:hypothetical protein
MCRFPGALRLCGNIFSTGAVFCTFLVWGNDQGKFRGKFSPKICWEKMEFSEEKVLKNCFSKKFHGIFCGK